MLTRLPTVVLTPHSVAGEYGQQACPIVYLLQLGRTGPVVVLCCTTATYGALKTNDTSLLLALVNLKSCASAIGLPAGRAQA